MALTMARPYKHPRTGIYWFRKVVPAPLRSLVGQRELKASLKTRDPAIAKVAMRDVLDRFDALLAAARAKALGTEAVLSLREITAAVGVAYREEAAKWVDDPGDERHWEDQLGYFIDLFEPDEDDETGPRTFTPDRHVRHTAANILKGQGIVADDATVVRAAEVWAREQIHFATLMLRRVQGDWSVSTGSERFPRPAVSLPEAAPIPLSALLASWAAETGKTGKALYDRERTVKMFTDFLGHDDAARVTPEDAVRFKEARLALGRSHKTVANDLNELSPIWRWAKSNRKLTFTENPFAGIAPMKRPTAQRARRPYTSEEARRVLQKARGETGLLRWLPWLLAFTGARLGELAQAVKEDIAPVQGAPGAWAMHIHGDGEGRSLKTPQSRRHVPLHPALIEEGLLTYLEELPAGSSLFPKVGLDKFGTRKGRAGNKHAKWVREVVGITDATVDPAHGWRHLWEDRARQSGMPQTVADALMGHLSAVNESEGYGRGFRFMPETTREHVARMVDPSLELPQ